LFVGSWVSIGMGLNILQMYMSKHKPEKRETNLNTLPWEPFTNSISSEWFHCQVSLVHCHIFFQAQASMGMVNYLVTSSCGETQTHTINTHKVPFQCFAK
jgi:hypothetical protein